MAGNVDPNFGYELELELNQCANVYGQAPCTAVGSPGFECYNCYSTCQDKPNYIVTTGKVNFSADLVRPPPLQSPPPTPATFDPSILGEEISLSADDNGTENMRMGGNGAANWWGTARSTTSKTSGKWVFELQTKLAYASNTSEAAAGFCPASFPADGFPGWTGFAGVSIDNKFNLEYGFYQPDNTTASGHDWTNINDKIMVAIDLDNLTAGWVSGGTYISNWSISGGAWHAVAACDGGSLIANFGANDFTETIPPGFSAWNDSSTGVVPTDSYPCITKPPVLTPTEIKRGDGLAVRGAATITLRDFVATDAPPMGLDPYWETRLTPVTGTFFPRFKSRYPFLQRSKALLYYYTWAVDGTQVMKSVREYVFDTMDGPDPSGTITIKLKDVFSSVEGTNHATPLVDESTLTSNINNNVTSIGISNPGPGWTPTDNIFRIDDEIITYAAFDGTTATGCIRGAYNSTPVKHDAPARTQIVTIYDTENVVDVIYDLLVVQGGMDPRHIPYNNDPGNPDEWDIEKANYLSGHNITMAIPEPRTVGELVKSLCIQCYLHLWFEPTTSKLRLAATNTQLAELDATPISDAVDILAGTTRIKEKRKGMYTQGWVYYDKITPLAANATENFTSLAVETNTELESPEAWGEERRFISLADWLNGAGNIAIVTAQRIIRENTAPRYEVTFDTDNEVTPLLTGEFITLRSDRITRADGTPENLSCQIIKANETIPTVSTRYTATILRVIDPDYTPRFGLIVNVANEGVEYGDALPADRDQWAWIADQNGFNNGDDPYSIL